MLICVVSELSDSYPCLDESNPIIRSKPGETVPLADVYVWDYKPGLNLQSRILERDGAQHLVLADSKALEEIGPLPQSVCILLKPITVFTLRAFVDLALKAYELGQRAREVENLRTDRDALLQYVLEVNLKLQEYDQERSNFLARAIHDFRAPLTALHGYCGLLAEGKLGPVTAGQKELLERMRYSTRRLTRLAGGTLELLTQGRFKRIPDRNSGDMDQAFDQALHDVYPLILDKQIEIDVQMEPVAEGLSFEAEQIEQVLMNLLENSTKFTPKGGKITIRGYLVHNGAEGQDSVSHMQLGTREGYRVDVLDSGPGVPKHLAEKVFEQYASYGGTEDRSGGGLGLAICRAIVVGHGGAIWTTPGREGGRFSFVLPLIPSRVQGKSTVYPSLQIA